MGLTSDTKNWNYELIDALDVFDMLDVDEITIKSSLARKESRGPFYREDYPRIDNINFLKYSIIRREDGDDVISFEPIKFKSVKAPQGIVDYFEADY
jgi:succinate dehydrogenase/fumarate reductase flavoprotein subunit